MFLLLRLGQEAGVYGVAAQHLHIFPWEFYLFGSLEEVVQQVAAEIGRVIGVYGNDDAFFEQVLDLMLR